MVAVVWAETAEVVTVNVAVVDPAGIVTLDGTVADVTLLDKATEVPPVPAAPLRVTFPVDGFPPATVAGFNDIETTVAGLIVSVADWVPDPNVAVIVALVRLETALDVAVNVADVAPPAIVTDAGTAAAALLLASEITSPAVGAGLLIVTVPVEEAPPTTEFGFKARDVSVGGLMVSDAVSVAVPSVAVMVEFACAGTAVVLTENVADVEPAATVTFVGKVAAELLLDRATVVPPEPAGPLRVTVPVEVDPPITVVGFRFNELRVAGLIVRVAF